MKKTFKQIIILLMALLPIAAMAQVPEVKKQVVRVMKFTNNGNLSNEQVQQLRSQIIQALTETGRVMVYDEQKQDAVRNEEERRKTTIGDDRDLGDNVLLQANVILTGEVGSCTATRKHQDDKYDKKGNKIQEAKSWIESVFSYTLSLIDPSTSTPKFMHTYSVAGTGDTDEEATNNALRGSAVGNIKDFIEANFAASGQIIKVSKDNGKKAEEVYINMGSSQGIAKGNRLKAYAVIDVMGEQTNKEIGELEVKEVASPNRSLCKVKKGGEEILQALAQNATVNVQSYAHHSFWEKTGLGF